MKFCPACACPLRELRLHCPDCRRPTISWMHVAFVAVLDAAGLFYLMALFK